MKRFYASVFLGLLLASQVSAAPKNETPPGWARCAVNGTVCENHGPAVVRYGYTDNWSVKEIKGGVDCVPAAFLDGMVVGNPFAGEVPDVDKWCELGK